MNRAVSPKDHHITRWISMGTAMTLLLASWQFATMIGEIRTQVQNLREERVQMVDKAVVEQMLAVRDAEINSLRRQVERMDEKLDTKFDKYDEYFRQIIMKLGNGD